MSAVATLVSHYFFEAKPLWTGRIGAAGVSDDTVQTIPLEAATNLTEGNAYIFRIGRVDAQGAKRATNLTEVGIGELSGTNFINSIRGAEGTAQAHPAGTVVEILMTASHWNKLVEGLGVEHGPDGKHIAALVTTLKATGAEIQTGTVDTKIVTPKAVADALIPNGKQIATPANPASGYDKLYFKSDDKLYKLTSGGVETEIGAGGAAFWTAFTGAYASATTITVAGVDVTGIMKKGVILRWLSSADAFKTGMVVSSSFSTDTTITIVGSTVEAGDKTFKYCIQMAQKETFIIPGTLGAATDIAKTWYNEEAVYVISSDLRVKTAGSGTGSTVIDINDDGTTMFATKPTITTTGTSDLDNVSSTPATAVAQGSAITVDVDSITATTAQVEAYVDVFYYPVNWTSRS